jgi:hypothetical protein
MQPKTTRIPTMGNMEYWPLLIPLYAQPKGLILKSAVGGRLCRGRKAQYLLKLASEGAGHDSGGEECAAQEHDHPR